MIDGYEPDARSVAFVQGSVLGNLADTVLTRAPFFEDFATDKLAVLALSNVATSLC
jgi:hypothetical protein